MRFVDNGCERPVFNNTDESLMTEIYDFKDIKSGEVYRGDFGGIKPTLFIFEIACTADKLAQNVINFKVDTRINVSLTVNGTEGKAIKLKRYYNVEKGKNRAFSATFGDNVKILSLKILTEEP